MRTTRFLGVKGGWGLQPIYARANVRVLQKTPRMAKVYGQTRILLMPSAQETFGLVGVEAMTCGIPVIAHPTPGLHESLSTAGIFVDRTDVAGWIAEIERLTDPTEWANASAAALLRAEELAAGDDRDRFADAIHGLALQAAA
jgi:glycosyltransferase involved in cell wall biosynthesis